MIKPFRECHRPTNGPWRVDGRDVITEDFRVVVSCPSFVHSVDEADANLRFIARAPDNWDYIIELQSALIFALESVDSECQSLREKPCDPESQMCWVCRAEAALEWQPKHKRTG